MEDSIKEARDKLVKKEFNRLKKIFRDIEEDKFKTVVNLINRAAFLHVQMNEIETVINEQGRTVEYQNGENQWGVREHPDIKTYNAFLKQYTAIIKDLTNLLPSTALPPNNDLFEGLKKPQ